MKMKSTLTMLTIAFMALGVIAAVSKFWGNSLEAIYFTLWALITLKILEILRD